MLLSERLRRHTVSAERSAIEVNLLCNFIIKNKLYFHKFFKTTLLVLVEGLFFIRLKCPFVPSTPAASKFSYL